MSSLAESVRVFQGRDLTAEEKERLIKFQEIYEISDDDPLVAVLAMIGAHKILMESVPDLLFKRAIEAIELHQQTLQEQSTLIAKELIVTIFPHVAAAKVQGANKNKYVLMYFAGIYSGLGALWIGRLLGYA